MNLTAVLYGVRALKINGYMPHFSNVYMLCDEWNTRAECLFIEKWKNWITDVPGKKYTDILPFRELHLSFLNIRYTANSH